MSSPWPDLPAAQLSIACNGLVESIGRVLEGSVSHPFTAHPKKDPVTGELGVACQSHYGRMRQAYSCMSDAGWCHLCSSPTQTAIRRSSNEISLFWFDAASAAQQACTGYAHFAAACRRAVLHRLPG